MKLQTMKNKLEKILLEANTKIEDLDIGEEEFVIFKVSFDGNEYIEKLRTLVFALCYEPKDEKLLILVPRLYDFQDEQENMKLKVLNAINDVVSGKVTIDDKDNALIYEHNLNIPIEKFSKEVIEAIKLDIVIAIATLAKVILGEDNEE